VINIVTKSGGNNFHGSAFGLFPQRISDAATPFAIVLQSDNRLARIKPPSSRQQFGGSLEATIAKDRTFFFAAYEQLRRRNRRAYRCSPILSIFQPTTGPERHPERPARRGRRPACARR